MVEPTTEVMLRSEIWDVLRVLVPAVLVIIGWVIVSRDNNNRETRKETRQFLDRTIKLLEEIEADAVSYFITADQVEAQRLSSKIDPALMRVESALSHLKLVDKDGESINAIVVRDKVTGNANWRSAQKVALAADCATIYQVNVAFAELIQSLESSYTQSYQK